jgi:signal recognition particle GTPase
MQLGQLKWMGFRGDAPAGMPGMGNRITGGEDSEPRLRRIRGMLDAMTKQERDNPDLLGRARANNFASRCRTYRQVRRRVQSVL